MKTIVVLAIILLVSTLSNFCFAFNESLSQDVRSSQNWYPAGENVPIIYTIKNTGSAPITYRFTSGKQFDIWVTDNGNEVYRLSDGMMYSQAFSNITLDPGESKEFRAAWNQRDKSNRAVDPGFYTIHAKLLPMGASTNEVSSRVTVRNTNPVVMPENITVTEARSRFSELKGRPVQLTGMCRSERRSTGRVIGPSKQVQFDWSLTDSTGTISLINAANLSNGVTYYVTGKLESYGDDVRLVVESAVRK